LKISKSATDPNSHILPTGDSYETIAKRIRGAVTGSIPSITFDPVKRPGTSNILAVLSACTGEALAVLTERYARGNPDAPEKDVVEAVKEALQAPRSV
jgi:tryptophanyl-tRNA synthetase